MRLDCIKNRTTCCKLGSQETGHAGVVTLLLTLLSAFDLLRGWSGRFPRQRTDGWNRLLKYLFIYLLEARLIVVCVFHVRRFGNVDLSMDCIFFRKKENKDNIISAWDGCGWLAFSVWLVRFPSTRRTFENRERKQCSREEINLSQSPHGGLSLITGYPDGCVESLYTARSPLSHERSWTHFSSSSPSYFFFFVFLIAFDFTFSATTI